MRVKSAKRFVFLIVAFAAIQNGEIFSQEINKIPTALVTGKQYFSFKSMAKAERDAAVHGVAPAAGGKIDLLGTNKLAQPIGESYYSDRLPFFCRTELQLEKAIKVPVKFRLGSVAYTDYLEKKPNAVKP